MIKYFLYLDSTPASRSAVLALRYSPDEKEFVIGGYTRFELQIREIIETFFSFTSEDYSDRVRRRLVQKNKAQFTIVKVSLADACHIFSEMRQAGFTLQSTTTLLNIMR